MKETHIKTFVHSIITFILVVSLLCFGIVYYNTLKKNDVLAAELNTVLASAQNELSTVQNELEGVNENLKNEIKKSAELSKSLESANSELENIKTEFETASTTIENLKSEEYELVYMGNFRYTYYCDERYEHICGYGIGLTASGKPTEVGWTVAADTSVLPMGSIIYVEGIGFREVMDRGGGVKGNHIDILLPTHNECFEQTLVNGGVWILVKKNS